MATPIDDDTLQRFYDGDLSPLEEHSVQARVENDPGAQRRLAELAKLTALLRDAAQELAKEVDSKALLAGIEADIAKQEKLGFGARIRVVTSEWVEYRRATLVPIVTATAVAAATLLMVTRSGPVDAPVSSEGAAAAEGQGSENASGPETVAVHGTRVEEVDFGTNTGTVFEIEDRGVAVAVVWITEDEETP